MTKLSDLQLRRLQNKKEAEASLLVFINLVHPRRWLGNIHREVISWMTASNKKSHQLLLLPRDHMKSALAAYYVAWCITRNPSIRILYISSTSNLAKKQLKFIKDILTCANYRLHWPEMVNEEEMKREQWTQTEISVDHPQRAYDAIRDPTIFTAGLTSNIVGLHCDLAVLDDVITQKNAYTEEGRETVKTQYSYLSSIEGTGADELIVGTRYHPLDLYSELIDKQMDDYDDEGNILGADNFYEVLQYPVESIGDGTGEFLWPRTKAPDGKWYGFNAKELAIKRLQYQNATYFRAQYYNDPHDVDSSPIQKSDFQYYDPKYLYQKDGYVFFKRERLNVVAAADFAYTVGKKSDYTAIVVIGVDGAGNYYILEVDRFKTQKASEIYNRILKAYEHWGFRKIRIEVTAAQSMMVDDFKDNYIRKQGLSLSIDEFKPSRWQGSKEERMMSTLEPKYANKQIWHAQGSGNMQLLEEELMFTNPPHDDIKDALASAIDFAVPPTNFYRAKMQKEPEFQYHQRWGGVN